MKLLPAAGAAIVLGTTATVAVTTFVATPKLVTNTTGGKNQNPSLDKRGNLIVFTSSANHVLGVTASPAGTFDFDGAGNGFTAAGAVHPDPSCANCSAVDAVDGQLFLWRKRRKGLEPANSVRQLTFQAGGGFEANQSPDINQKGTVIAWDSNRNHVGTNPDLNREIFLFDLATGTIIQATNTTGGGEAANRSVNWRDDGRVLVFESSRNYQGVLGCTLADRATECDNADENSEIMLFNRSANTLTQITSTTGDMGVANRRPRISNDGRYLAFQSTRSFSGVLPGGATCTQRDGVTACSNDNNGEIMLFELQRNAFTQITKTTNTFPCDGASANERVEISAGAKYLTWQSRCEAALAPTTCASCAGNDEAFLFERETGAILQLTISANGFNRVPRVAGRGKWIIFASDRNYAGLNPGAEGTLYVLKTSTKPGPPGIGGEGQLIADPASTLAQNDLVNLVGIGFAGGFNTTVEQFGASNNGRYFTFDNQKGVGNQEIWFLDRRR